MQRVAFACGVVAALLALASALAATPCLFTICHGTFLVLPVTASVVAIAFALVSLVDSRSTTRRLALASLAMAIAPVLLVLVIG